MAEDFEDEVVEDEEAVGDPDDVDLVDDLEDDLDDDLEADIGEDDFEAADVEDEEEAEDEAPAPRARKVNTDDEDDDDELDPDDIEADLSDILQDRMATDDDDEDEEDDDAPKVSAQRDREFVCNSCFLMVNRSQFGSAKSPRCPVGDPDCPSISQIFS